MAIDTTTPRTRRTLLLGALGVAGASVAAAVGRASPVAATDGDVVHVGHTYSATTRTEFVGPGASAAFLKGGVGVVATSDAYVGVHGSSGSGMGVFGNGGTGIGVYGTTSGPGVSGVVGVGAGTGVQGFSGQSGPPAPPGKTGVHGFANQNTAAVGVNGQSPKGRGGVFSGGTAQVRLIPSDQKAPNGIGLAGDLFVDKYNNLWFCKGGTIWKQIA